MVIDEMNLKIFKKRNNGLINKFAAIIFTSILSIIFFTSFYNYFTSKSLMDQYKIDRELNYRSIANVIFKSSVKDLKDKNFTNINQIANTLIENNLVLYVGIINKKTKNYVWFSDKKLIGTKTEIYVPWINSQFVKKFKNTNAGDLKEVYKEFDNNCVVFGFLDTNATKSLLNLIISGNITLSFVFILLAYAVARIMARSVTKPIKELVIGAEQFSKGNLKYKAKVNSDDELGNLANSFNEIAEKLDFLYSSLEQKVKDRTNELSVKNEQLEKAYVELKDAQTMLIHNEKMTSLGQLVAGVAHELNNPINFIYGNMEHLKNYSSDLIKIVNNIGELSDKLSPDISEEFNKIKEEKEFDYIVEDLPDLIKSCKDGAERCKQIILDLKNFSRLDEAEIKEVDIHEGLDSTLNILLNKYKNKIILHKQYGNIPRLACYAGQLNQVFMNIIDNASQAVGEKGDVIVKTDFIDNNIIVIIEDNGKGIDKKNLSKIFDPFFTTKAVGEGTGLGLSISYKIVKSHGGTIDVESEKDKGTKFTIKLPINSLEKVNINELNKSQIVKNV